MKNTIKKTADFRRKRFLLQFQRYLEKYLKRPGFRNGEKRVGNGG